MKKIKYTEPTSYMPKSIRDKHFGKQEKPKANTVKKTDTKKKGK